MKLKLFISFIVFISGLLYADNWTADASKAKITFTVKGPFGTVNGTFSGLKTTIRFDEKDLGSSSIVASIDPKTVSSGNGLRNSDLKSKEVWLNTDKFSEISFHSKKIEKTSTGFKASGELTLKGVTKPVEIPFTFTSNGNTGIFKGKFTIKREDFHVGKPGGSVGNDVAIGLEIPVKK
jgi:polyisoprenoid-binding protein YceI